MRAVRSSRSDAASVFCLPLGLLSGCETNPYTGRSQFLMTSVSDEMQMGAQAYHQVKSDPKMKQSQDPREIEPVKTSGGPHHRSGEAVEVCRDGAAVSVGSDGDQGRQDGERVCATWRKDGGVHRHLSHGQDGSRTGGSDGA